MSTFRNRFEYGMFPFFQHRYYNGVEGQLRFISTNSTITPALTVSGGPTPIWHVTESTGVTFKYESAAFSHTKTAGTGNLTVRLINTEAVKSYVTGIDFNTDGIISSFWNLQIDKFTGLVQLYLHSNSFTGDLSGWTLPTGLVHLYLYSNSFTGDLSGWTLPTGLVHLHLHVNSFTGDLSGWTLPTGLVLLYLRTNSFTGDLSGWTLPTGLVQLYINSNSFTGDLSGWTLPTGLVPLHLHSNSFTGDLSGWTLPTSLVQLYLHSNSFTGDLSGWTLPTGLVLLYLYSNSFTYLPTPAVGASPLQAYQAQDNGITSQAAIDAAALAFYNNRANFTYTTPTINVGGTNVTPTGIYQDGDPPTTGKEYIYEVVNDPEAEGFNKQEWTYTA